MLSNSVEPTNQQPTEVSSSSTTANPSSKPPMGKPKNNNRRGKGATQKREDKFRERKNAEGHAKWRSQVAHLVALLDEESASASFGDIAIGTVSDPPISVPVNTDRALDVAEATAVYLENTLKIPPPPAAHPSDAITLKHAVCYQVMAREVYARAGSPCAVDADQEFERPSEKVALRMGRAPISIAAYLACIGRFQYGKQTIYPQRHARSIYPTQVGDLHHLHGKLEIAPVPPELMPGEIVVPNPLAIGRLVLRRNPDAGDLGLAWCMVHNMLDEDGVLQLPPNGLLNEDIGEAVFARVGDNAVSVFLRRELPPAPPAQLIPLDILSGYYTNLIGRIERKARGSVVQTNIKEGLGTPAQLVGCRYLDENEVEAWCGRDVGEDQLAYGAVFNFGLLTEHPLHSPLIAQISRSFYIAGALKHLATVIASKGKKD